MQFANKQLLKNKILSAPTPLLKPLIIISMNITCAVKQNI